MSKPVISEYRYHGTGETDTENRVIDILSIQALIDSAVDAGEKDFCKKHDFAFYGSGWQSWGFGGELDPGCFQKRYIPVVPQWKQYFSIPGVQKKIVRRKKLLQGSFFIYLRWNNGGKNTWLCIASVGNVHTQKDGQKPLPPVNFFVDRKRREIVCTACTDGKRWEADELMAQIAVFSAADFFTLRDTTRNLFAEDRNARFGSLAFLNTRADSTLIRTGGWESWYNHYADINHTLIEGDLQALGTTENLIKTELLDANAPCVFQVDDGWEIALGDWDARTDRFPGGMKALSQSIADKGYIPGLWMAPFAVDWRSETARAHRDWILRGNDGKPIAAGMNLLWGARFGREQPSLPYSYFCLDLSRDDVIAHLDALMEKAVNEWGFRYLKLDFLFAGLLAGAHANGGAAYEWYDKAVRTLTRRTRNNRGEPVAYLGCGMPFESSFNAFPLSRIGPDTKEAWDIGWMKRAQYEARPSAFASLQSTLGHAFWDNAVYINDPDVVFLRYQNISLNDKEKLLIALVNFLFASQLMHSDDPVHFDAEKEGAFTQKVRALYRQFDGVEFGLENLNSTSYRIFSRDGAYAGCINLGEKPVTVTKATLCKSKEKSLAAVLEYAQETADSYIFEPHSISMYALA
ncbi:MAG: alpha-galactosidase [Treponema sp.]|nr:alpha-galactosidase [Treponema sp.]